MIRVWRLFPCKLHPKPGPNGYAYAWNGHKVVSAHRWAYEQRYGFIPEGLDLDHLCRRRNCTQPRHLEPVTRQVNIRRGLRFGSGVGKPWCDLYCKRGHRKYATTCWECKQMHNAYWNAEYARRRKEAA